MNRDELNDHVRKVVRAGGTVNVAGMVSQHGVPKEDAKAWLEALYEAGELELDLDENEHFVYTKGKNLGAARSASAAMTEALAPAATAALTNAAKDKAKEVLLGSDDDDPTKKKVLWGLGLGFLLPGLGLFYSAPWITAVVTTAAVGVVVAILSLLSGIPILGGMVMYIVVGVLMLISGVLGGIYTWQYNKHGTRTRLSKASPERRALPF